ncbi:MAG TPA: hypothetical protein VMU48_18675 [Terracidiphilus sp.]|nr:hypothetical protein [Terracidiphilus sp.]
MHCGWIVVAALMVSSVAMAQNAIPSGTILPVALETGLNASKIHAGQPIRAEVMQNVPDTPIRRHARVLGHVIEASALPGGLEKLTLQFDAIEIHGKRIPIHASLRAVASFLDVEDAMVPEEGASRGITPEVATTEQIGGEQVYRGGGPVSDGMAPVGVPVPYGVLAVPRPNPHGNCRGVIGENTRQQALWLFSTDACGVYGIANLRIDHAGRTDPMGTIVLSSATGKLKLYGGTGMLLRIRG